MLIDEGRGGVVTEVWGEDVKVEVVFHPPTERLLAAVQALQRLCPREGDEGVSALAKRRS